MAGKKKNEQVEKEQKDKKIADKDKKSIDKDKSSEGGQSEKSKLKEVVDFVTGREDEARKKEEDVRKRFPGFVEFFRTKWSETGTEPEEEQKPGFFRKISKIYRDYQNAKEKEEDKHNTYEQIAAVAALNREFITLLIGSCLIATFGLLMGSTAVIIGAMLIAPLMVPILGFSLGTIWGDRVLLWRSVIALIVGTAVVIAVSTAISAVVPGVEFNHEISSRFNPTLFDIMIAVASGMVGAYAYVNPNISSSVSGVAIAVALMPPICSAGIAFGQGAFKNGLGAFLLYLINLAGITLSASFIFWRLKVHPIERSEDEVRQYAQRNVYLATAFLILISLPLGFFMYETYDIKMKQSYIRDVITTELKKTEIINLKLQYFHNKYKLKAVVIVPPGFTAADAGNLNTRIRTLFDDPIDIDFVPVSMSTLSGGSPAVTAPVADEIEEKPEFTE